jgi:8-oxo-dGTP diphosphatase
LGLDKFASKISKAFGNKLRIRVCGILIEDDKVLLVKHRGLGENGFLWSPPGGGLEFGETISNGLKREFYEETGLFVKNEKFILINEHLELPLHAIELFYQVEKKAGELRKGSEPEITGSPIIEEVKFFSLDELKDIKNGNLHKLLRNIDNIKDLLNP